MLRFSMPIAASSLLTGVMQADVLLLGTYVNRAPGVTVETFGVFCAAAQIAGGLRKVRRVFDPIFAPIVASRRVSDDRAALRATVAGPQALGAGRAVACCGGHGARGRPHHVGLRSRLQDRRPMAGAAVSRTARTRSPGLWKRCS
jgi:hypothetical protein